MVAFDGVGTGGGGLAGVPAGAGGAGVVAGGLGGAGGGEPVVLAA